MPTSEQVSRAVELLRYLHNTASISSLHVMAASIKAILAELEPKPASKSERIAEQLDALADIWTKRGDYEDTKHLRNLAAIHRETT